MLDGEGIEAGYKRETGKVEENCEESLGIRPHHGIILSTRG